MKYKFIVDYTPTDPFGVASQRVCSPTYGNDLAVTIEMESDEWYRKRKLEGELTFMREDYGWIMGQAFDGTFKLTMQSSNDGGATWQNYLEGTFSRANLEIDEDNQNVVLNGLNDGGEYNAIENGKSEEYDLMKIIPDADAKEVRGEVHPALALVDYRTAPIEHSDIFCDASITAGGYKSDYQETEWNKYRIISTDSKWNTVRIFAEAKIEMKDGYTDGDGIYCGVLQYQTTTVEYDVASPYTSVSGSLYKQGSNLPFDILFSGGGGTLELLGHLSHSSSAEPVWTLAMESTSVFSPQSIEIEADPQINYHYKKITIIFHYIRATLLTLAGGNSDNVLDTGDYYKRMQAFNNAGGGLRVAITTNTVEQSNGHRLVPGSGEQGTVPQYFAPPDETEHWISLAEYGWQYASMWYTIEPSVANGLLNSSKVGLFRWTRCWTLGTCLDRLLRKITNNRVTFDQNEAGSEFLYSTVNPLTQGEPFEYLFTQKSNVMRPSVGGEGASRCIVRLDWFLEFLRNALNCYWWLEERNGGTYAFRVEHVEWFRRGGSYTGQMDAQFDLTEIKTRRNFLRNGEAAKRLDDQLHKYSYEMNGMTEKYLFSWQGDGGSDAFKGNPMWFKAGWVENGTNESKEVDNIFADLSWLMLNAGSDTASSKNYDGIFVFSGYQAGVQSQWRENSLLSSRYIALSTSVADNVWINIWCVVPAGQAVDYEMYDTTAGEWVLIKHMEGFGTTQIFSVKVTIGHQFRVNFGANYGRVFIQRIHRVHESNDPVYRVPNTLDRLTEDGYLQNGPLAWPWLQCEFLHYDIPAQRWGYKYDDLDDLDSHNAWETDGTVKLRKKQDVPLLPLPTKSDEEDLDKGVIGGLKDSQGQLQTGIVKSATINLGTRNATLTLMYDMIS